MEREKGFEIDRRVTIAMDALTPSQKVVLDLILHDKENFVKYASVPGRAHRLSANEPVYKMEVGSAGLQLIYSMIGDDIDVLDIMHKKTMNRFGPKPKRKVGSSKTRLKPPSAAGKNQ
jgi:hypothetical protein